MVKKLLYIVSVICGFQGAQGVEQQPLEQVFTDFSMARPNTAPQAETVFKLPEIRTTYLKMAGNIVLGMAALIVPELLYGCYYSHRKSQGLSEEKLKKDGKIKGAVAAKIIVQVSSLYFFQQAYQSFCTLQQIKKYKRLLAQHTESVPIKA